MYFEVEFPFEYPLEYRKYLPNVHFVHKDIEPGVACLKAVSAIALRRISNEELFSDYCFIGREPKIKE